MSKPTADPEIPERQVGLRLTKMKMFCNKKFTDIYRGRENHIKNNLKYKKEYKSSYTRNCCAR